ncbi:MAG: ribosome hibernation-promoting factor, HPF/YfiA family [Eggerthellaceae bacterium]|jgi:putative sigma-54 modulation protein
MEITVTGRTITVTPALRDYAQEKIGSALKVMDIDPLNADVVLLAERNPANASPCVCEVTAHTKGQTIRVEEREDDMYAAIDIAAAKVSRQLRKYKTKVVDRRQRRGGAGEILASSQPATDFDKLMEELSADDDEIVREKVVDFKPETTEEALIEIDLLGHDFHGFIDRDSNAFCIVYRRENGGYGLLKQKMD